VDHLIQRSEFLTSYTPYQPEIAQGTLQYLFEFQTQVAALTGMEVANASMYDGSTGTGEAVLMAHRVTKRRKAVLSGGLHPHYVDVVKTLSEMSGDAGRGHGARRERDRGHPVADRRNACPASSCSRRTCSATCVI
jgi:glycine dehydrogenase subunit 1